MSIVGKTPEGVSLRLGVTKQPFHVALMSTIGNPIFPFITLKFKPEENAELQDAIVEVKLPQKYFELIKGGFMSDELTIYVPLDGAAGFWSFDMLMTFRLMADLGMMSSLEEWTKTSRDVMVKITSNQKANPIRVNKEALIRAERILSELKLLDQIKNAAFLFAIVREVVNQAISDPDTIMYRTAMAIFHSKNLSGQAVFDSTEDAGSLYLELIQTSFYNENKEIFKAFSELPINSRSAVAKIFIMFVIAAFLYYTITSE